MPSSWPDSDLPRIGANEATRQEVQEGTWVTDALGPGAWAVCCLVCSCGDLRPGDELCVELHLA